MTNNGLYVIPFELAMLAWANLFWQIVELTCSLSSYANLVSFSSKTNRSTVSTALLDSHTSTKHPNKKCTCRNCVMLLSLRFTVSTIAVTLATQTSLLASLNVCESVPPSLDLTLPWTPEIKIFPRAHYFYVQYIYYCFLFHLFV